MNKYENTGIPVNLAAIFSFPRNIKGVPIKTKDRGIKVLIVVAAVALPGGTPFLLRKYTWAIPPPLAKGVTLEINMLIKTSLKI